jgi:hypothetical protein
MCALEPKTCIFCGETFTPKTACQKTCQALACRRALRRAKNRRAKERLAKRFLDWDNKIKEILAQERLEREARAVDCLAKENQAPQEKKKAVCVVCGAPTGAQKKRFCSMRCMRELCQQTAPNPAGQAKEDGWLSFAHLQSFVDEFPSLDCPECDPMTNRDITVY